jgi:predicted SAM-dependent methyltransferase
VVFKYRYKYGFHSFGYATLNFMAKKGKKSIPSTRAQVKKAFPNGILRLEIGSGAQPESGYVHLDIQHDLPDLDILADVRKMPLPDEFVTEEIRAVHIMEHFCHPKYAGQNMIDKYGTTTDVIKEMYRVLAPGGKIKIVTPDYEKIAQSVAKKRIPMQRLQQWSVGGHNDEYDVHHWLWSMYDAQEWLTNAGFRKVKDWNPIRHPHKKWFLDWSTEDRQGNQKWHDIEWYHWLFVEATK